MFKCSYGLQRCNNSVSIIWEERKKEMHCNCPAEGGPGSRHGQKLNGYFLLAYVMKNAGQCNICIKRRLNILSLVLSWALWCCLCCPYVISNRVEPPLNMNSTLIFYQFMEFKRKYEAAKRVPVIYVHC